MFLGTAGNGNKASGDEGQSDGGDGAEGEGAADAVDMAKLRKYEADKMKYYYAVAEFDSARTGADLGSRV